MSQPVFVGDTKNSGSSVSSLVLTRTCTVLNTLVVGIALADGSQSVSGITDSAGSVMGVPVNHWQPIGGNRFGAVRLEYWACRSIAAITSLTITLTGAQYIRAMVAEYSGVSAFGVTGALQVNAYQNPHPTNNLVLIVSEEAVSSQLMVTFFAVGSINFGGTLVGIQRDQTQFSGSLPGLSLAEQGTADANNLLDTEIAVAQLATAVNLAASNLQGITLLLSGGLTLRSQPGFCDIPDSSFASGQVCRGINLAKISENAELGMVRFEVFYGTYRDGDTVNLPVSTVDSYSYTREECLYVWAPKSTVNPATGWASAEEALWYCNWQVDQWQSSLSPGGGVHCEEWYTWIHSSKPNSRTTDGILAVFTIAQRRQRDLILATTPSYSDIADTTFYQDEPLEQADAQQMNENAKFAVVSTEAIYMGEFVDADTVPRPISPADGYVYAYANCVFIPCWRWTYQKTSYTAPTSGLFLQRLESNVTYATGVVHCDTFLDHVASNSNIDAMAGRVAVFAICTRPVTGTPFSLGNEFSEVDLTEFQPGNPLPHELLQQVNDNTQEAISVPEIFTHLAQTNGYTVPLPVSPRDGYQYARSEIIVLWSIHSTGPDSAERLILFEEYVDQSTGVATIAEFRLPHGGVGTLYNDGSLDIVVIAIRSGSGRLPSGASSSTVTQPGDLGSPAAGGVATVTVNGV